MNTNGESRVEAANVARVDLQECPLVSVVIPVFNREGQIRAAIESVLRQTYSKLEVVVVDDGSTDGTVDEIEKIEDDRIRLVHMPENGGPSAARNLGIKESKGEWIAFQDSDDEWLPRKLELQMDALLQAEKGAIACFCGMSILTKDDALQSRTRVAYHPDPAIQISRKDMKQAVLRYSLVSTQTLIVRADMLRACGGFDTSLRALEDWDCTIRLSLLGDICFVDLPLVNQTFSANSLTHHGHSFSQARRMIFDKHLGLFKSDPIALSRVARSIAGDLRRTGEAGEAAKYLFLASKASPGNLALWPILFVTVAMSLKKILWSR
ncbi:MAG: glycosyltransferase [Paracoccaceae bacterium]|nr:glycosyltransferase [Paracoccaceae bacterium]